MPDYTWSPPIGSKKLIIYSDGLGSVIRVLDLPYLWHGLKSEWFGNVFISVFRYHLNSAEFMVKPMAQKLAAFIGSGLVGEIEN